MQIAEKISKVGARLRSEGIWATARWAAASTFYFPVMRWLDHRFDRRYGTDTTAPLRPDAFDVDPNVRRHAVEYVASPAASFLRVLESQRLDYASFTFVDLGCGKGRALLLAAKHLSFQQVIGVEIEPRLHATCERNIAAFVGATSVHCVPRAICMSAGDFDYPSGDLLVYMFNPFGEFIVEQVANRLRAALEAAPRRLRIVYSHPNADRPLLRIPGVELLQEHRFRDRSSLHGQGRINVYGVPGERR